MKERLVKELINKENLKEKDAHFKAMADLDDNGLHDGTYDVDTQGNPILDEYGRF